MRYFLLYLVCIFMLFEACNTPLKDQAVSEHPNNTLANDSISQIRKRFPFLQKYTFDAYNTVMLKSNPAAPVFKNNPFSGDPDYVNFLIKGCRRGVNFGGHYTIIEKSCGSMCSKLFIVDRLNGKVLRTIWALQKWMVTTVLGTRKIAGY